jgi:biopolymer transport protein ExbD
MNVTPLVDVVLVLLIIFMIVIPAMEEGLNLEVPGIANVDDKSDKTDDAFLLTLTRDGDILFDESRVTREDLEELLKARTRREPSRRLVLRADGRLPYADVRELYAKVQGVGFPGVSLRVNKLGEEGQQP